MLISPGYHYESVSNDIFLTRKEIQAKFQRILELAKRFRLTSTPMFLEFAAGLRDYACSPWSTVTFTPQGWKAPCYLIGNEYTFDWSDVLGGHRLGLLGVAPGSTLSELRDALGFEASAVRALGRSPRDMVRMVLWNL